jgi:hypothetical protein
VYFHKERERERERERESESEREGYYCLYNEPLFIGKNIRIWEFEVYCVGECRPFMG